MNEHPSTIEEIYQDYSARYAGILVALTEGAHPRTHEANMHDPRQPYVKPRQSVGVHHIHISMRFADLENDQGGR